jgi:hypothetical protein
MGRTALKPGSAVADIHRMTATSHPSSAWASHPAGKAVRIFIAVTGMITATFVLMTASLVSSGSWVLVLLGVGLAASSVRAARVPSTFRLALVGAALIAIPLSIQIF